MSDWPPPQPIEHGWPESESLIERVAMAIAKDIDTPPIVGYAKVIARIAIESLREPTEAMAMAGVRAIDDWSMGTGQARQIFTAMIDEALK